MASSPRSTAWSSPRATSPLAAHSDCSGSRRAVGPCRLGTSSATSTDSSWPARRRGSGWKVRPPIARRPGQQLSSGGGREHLTRWLTIADVEEAWARRLVQFDDLRMRQFIELRFRALASVAEADLAAALGPGTMTRGRERRCGSAWKRRRRIAGLRSGSRIRGGAPGSVHASSRSARSPIRCPGLPGVGAAPDVASVRRPRLLTRSRRSVLLRQVGSGHADPGVA